MMVCPGFTRTQLQSRALHRTKNQSAQEVDWVGKQAAPEEVARAIYQGAAKRKRLLILTPVGKLSYYLNKFVPAMYERMMARRLASISTVLEMTNGTADLGEADDKLLIAEPRHGCWGVGKS